MIKREDGIFSLYDTAFFFIFLLVASSIIVVVPSGHQDAVEERDREGDHCRMTRQAVLSATIEETGYDCHRGYIVRKDRSVRRLLTEQVHLETSGIKRKNFSYAADITRLIDPHLEGERWFLRVSSDDTEDLLIGRRGVTGHENLESKLGGEVVSSSWLGEGLHGEDMKITLYLCG